ncbi:MAG TPA: glucokinase [Kofleriaceae bacterium]|nr:glucokinase [Kofleriaceae bacterium]
MILAGDMGGTKTVLALCNERGDVVREKMFKCADFGSLEAIIDAFLVDQRVEAACFGVAGPVVDGVAHITNLPWTIGEKQLETKLGGPVRLLNDLQATAIGMTVLPATAFAVLQQGVVPPSSTIAVIAPGTGLGEATLVSDGIRYRALPSEGGHADFAPGTSEELALWQFMRDRHGAHVSVERVLCGNGIGDLYDFARKQSGAEEPQWLVHEMKTGDHNAAIANAALANRDPVCVKALTMWVSILGAEAGNHALRALATGGVVIGGGIPPKILPALQSGALLERFVAKGRFTDWMKGLSLRVALEPRAALLGAAHTAVMTMEQR